MAYQPPRLIRINGRDYPNRTGDAPGLNAIIDMDDSTCVAVASYHDEWHPDGGRVRVIDETRPAGRRAEWDAIADVQRPGRS